MATGGGPLGNQIQQGLLTYALVHDGLEERQADFNPKDRQITLTEWLGYGVERVPALYEEVRTGTVSHFGRGQESRGVVVRYGSQNSSLRKAGFSNLSCLISLEQTVTHCWLRNPENTTRSPLFHDTWEKILRAQKA